MTAEQLAQRALDVNIVDESQLQSVWGELGTRSVAAKEFAQALLRRDLITNYQLDRLAQGLRSGFFYGDYKVLYSVGAGTFARVFRAAHRATNQIYAVKVLRNRFSSPVTDPKNTYIIELFRREGELGVQLQHPNIVPVHEVVSQGVTHFIVMDFIEGRNLREFYRIRHQFQPLEAAEMMVGIVAGLTFAFQKGISHRDLKMSNVLIASDGVPKLVDFGLAALENEEVEDMGEFNRRTIEYAGLERSTGVRKDDTRSDVFFAGCMFYQLVAGRPAMAESRDRAQLLSKTRFTDIKPILELVPKLPLPLAMVISKATEFDPQRRYQSPGDMYADLRVAIKRVKEGVDTIGAQVDLHSREGHDEHGQPRKLMVVESEVKLQDLFRELFKRNGYRVLVASDPERAMDRFFDDQRAADLVLFNTASIGRPALEGFNRFGRETATRDLPAVLLLDERHQAWAAEAELADHRRIAQAPIKQRQLREAILSVVRPKAAK
ncbi:MAG: serine/threonine-protein kinase [Pirellulales bacterium]